MKPVKLVFAAGGTGGHIYPALSVANSIMDINPGSQILFIGAKGKMEEKIIPESGYELKTINITGIQKGSILSFPLKFISAVRESRKILKDFNPDVVAGTGGFVCGPVLYAASRMKIPALIQEGNSYPGKAVRFLDKKVDRIVINFEETFDYLKNRDNIVRIAHPVRFHTEKICKSDALVTYKFDPRFPVLFVFGGSQGAGIINDTMKKIIDDLCNNSVNIIWQTGVNDFDEIQELCSKYKSRIKVFKYIEDMALAYSASDLVVCRAGISSIMELAYFEMPAILIPLPTAAENHQEKNAATLVNKNACIMLLQNNINKLYDTIIKYIKDRKLLQNLSNNIQQFSDSKASEKIALEILKLAKNGK